MAALLGAVIGGAMVQAATNPLANAVRRRVLIGPLATIDGAGGLVAGTALGLAVAWLVAVTAINQPSLGLRHEVQSSTILPRLVRWVPAQSLIDAIARFDRLPVLGVGGVASLPPPDRSVPISPAVRRAERSVVMIEGSSCGLTLQGTGWVARPGLVVTNAHVISGEHETQVITDTGALNAVPVFVDPSKDIALLRVNGLTDPPLATRNGTPGGTGVALIGYPGGGPLTAAPGRVGHVPVHRHPGRLWPGRGAAHGGTDPGQSAARRQRRPRGRPLRSRRGDDVRGHGGRRAADSASRWTTSATRWRRPSSGPTPGRA